MGEGQAIPIIDGMREVAETSDAWLVDVWGVMHNGAEAFQAAAEACATPRGVPQTL